MRGARAAAMLLGLQAATVSADTPPARPPAGAIRFVEVGLADGLGLGDLRLTRTRQSRSVVFVADPRWTPAEGSHLRVVLSHSPQLDAGRSFLTVTLNHALLRSLRLDETNETAAEVVIPVPPGLVQRRNEVTFAVEQNAQGGRGEVWTQVAAQSAVRLAYRDEDARRDGLRDLPLPFVDPALPRPKSLDILLPRRIAAPTLEATALTIAYFALRAAPQPLRVGFVRSPGEGTAPLLVVGTPLEQPALREAVGAHVSWSDTPSGAALAHGGRALDPATGVLAIARLPDRPALAITANAPEGVLRAAWGLMAGPPPTADPSALIADEPRRAARATREWSGFLPPRTGFRLSEAGYGPQVLRDDAPLRMTLRATPDTGFLAYGHSISLSLRPLPALLEQPDARIEIAWNDVVVRRLRPAEMPRKPPYFVPLRLPGDALRPENVISIAWRSGAAGAAAGPLASLDPETSQLYLPRFYEARLPELGLLRASLYPFSLRPDLSDVIVVTPDAVTEEVFVLVCEAAAALGRVLPADLAGFRVRPAGGLTDAERATAHLMILRAGTEPDGFDSAFPDWRKARESAGALAVLQEAESPWSRGRYLLSLRASSATRLLRGWRVLTEDRGWRDISGDTVLINGTRVTPAVLGKPRAVREVDYLVYLDAWLRSHWLALPVVLAAVSALLFLALRLALAHRRGGGPYLTASSGANRPS